MSVSGRPPAAPTTTWKLVLCFFSSLFYLCAFPNFNFSWLAWVALIPLALLAQRSTPRQAFFWGWLSGTLAYSVILYWIFVTFQAANLSILLSATCLLLLAVYVGLFLGAWAWYISSVMETFSGAAAWVALELLRTHLFSGFPWALLGDSQVKILPLIQIASVTGVYGVSFLIVWVNLSIAQWKLRPMAFSLGIMALACLYGHHRLVLYAKEPSGPSIRVALLQGSIDQYKKWDKAYVDEIQRTYEQLASEASKSKPDMILWPETSVPGYLLQDPPLREWLIKVIRNTHTDHLIGAPSMRNKMFYNSAFSINYEGTIEGEYAKQHLVPFGEIVPCSKILGKFIRVLNDLGGFTAGDLSPVVKVAGVPVGVNICYEAIFPDLVRKSVVQGGQIIANLTNDGWYMKTSAPYQHWAPNILRAVENDRWLVRADNTGISGIIDPRGHVMAASALFQPGVIQGTVEARMHLTLYTRFGDLFAWVCIAVAFASLLTVLV